MSFFHLGTRPLVSLSPLVECTYRHLHTHTHSRMHTRTNAQTLRHMFTNAGISEGACSRFTSHIPSVTPSNLVCFCVCVCMCVCNAGRGVQHAPADGGRASASARTITRCCNRPGSRCTREVQDKSLCLFPHQSSLPPSVLPCISPSLSPSLASLLVYVCAV